MARTESRISLTRDGDSFVLHLSGGSRRSRKVILSEDNVLQFAQSAPGYRQEIMARRHPGAVFATPVSAVAAEWDALGENILMVVRFPANGSVIYEVHPDSSRKLAVRIQGACP
jgi:hypothetical protein